MALRYNHLQPLLISLLLASATLVQSQDQGDTINNGFVFNGFNSSSNLTLGGASMVTPNGALQLTNTSTSITGYAFYPNPFQILNPQTLSFSTNFVFQIVPQSPDKGGIGFVFLIAPSNRLQGTSPGGYLGALSPRNDGNASNKMFLVEFNTVVVSWDIPATQAVKALRKPDYRVSTASNLVFQYYCNASNHMFLVEFNTVVTGDHLAIHVNSLLTKSEITKLAEYYINDTNRFVPMKLEGIKEPNRAWIDYDASMEIVNVTIAPSSVKKPIQPLMSLKLNLSGVLKQDSYVGFSSATGLKIASSHYILGWSFRVNGLSWPLDLSILPRVEQPKTSTDSERDINGIGIGVGSSVATIVLFSILAGGFLYYHHQREKMRDDLEDWEVECTHRYPYKDLYKSTKGFKDSEVIGSGGFGQVYKGVLPRTKETVAIKKILHNSKQGIREFVAEIASLGRMRHKNLVHLHGWCKHKDELLLVYDFMPNGSLDNHIFTDQRNWNVVLSWDQRFRVLKGIASALVYLHEEWEQVVVHRDVKANNVLLDANMDGRLGDFGLSRLYDHGEHPSTTHIVGTLGYMAPELSQTGKATTQCDVYSFGALLLEVACGKRPIERESLGGGNVILLDWVRDCWTRGCICEAADPKLEDGYSRKEMELVLYLGLVCCQKRSDARPEMRRVTRYLDGSEVLDRVGTLEFAYSDTDTLSSSNISSRGRMSSGSYHVGGR